MPCDILAALPPELVIEVFAFLDPASLTRCTAVSKEWRNLIANDLLWRKVATEQLCLCPATVQVQDLATLPSLRRWSASDHLANLTSFRQLCVRWEQVLLGWRGRRGPALDDDHDHDENDNQPQHPSEIPKIQAISKFIRVVVPEGQLDVWRIEVDPEEGTLVATTRQGGLYVLDIKTNQVLWQLGGGQVGAFEHLEGERGILVISNTREANDEGFDVWVHRRLIPDGGNGDLYQLRSSLRILQRSYASRFKWPVFCAMGESRTAFFWDLSDPEQPRQLLSIDVSARYGHLDINYIDFDNQHFFLVGTSLGAVIVYDRATGQAKWSMAAHLRQADARSLIRFYKLDLHDFLEDAEHQSSPFELREQQLLAERYLNDKLDKAIDRLGGATVDDGRMEWVAIHPDEATGALLVLGQNMLAIIPDFASLSETNCRTSIMMVQYTDGEHYGMQFSLTIADGRATIVEDYPIVLDLAPQRKAPLTPGSAPFRLPEDPKDPPPVRVFASQNPFIGLGVLPGSCSCAQMDAANIFAVHANEAPVYPDAEDPTDTPMFEVLHWRIDDNRNWHGNVTLGVLGRPRGPVLTAHGLDQAAELATHFLSLPPESRPQLILSSPYYRTVQTSLLTSKALALPIHLEPGLAEWFPPVEVSSSDPEGTAGVHPYPPTRDLLEPYFPPDVLAPTHVWPPVLYAHPEVEDVPELHARAAQVLRRIERQCELLFPEVRRVLLVSHAATIIAMGRDLICKGPGAPWEQQEGGDAVGYHVGAGTYSLSQYDRRPSSSSQIRIGDLDLSTAFTHTLNASCDHLASGSEREWNFGHLPHNVTASPSEVWASTGTMTRISSILPPHAINLSRPGPSKADLDQQQAHWIEQEQIMAQDALQSLTLDGSPSEKREMIAVLKLEERGNI